MKSLSKKILATMFLVIFLGIASFSYAGNPSYLGKKAPTLNIRDYLNTLETREKLKEFRGNVVLYAKIDLYSRTGNKRDRQKAISNFKWLIKKYPNTGAAKRARHRIKLLKSKCLTSITLFYFLQFKYR